MIRALAYCCFITLLAAGFARAQTSEDVPPQAATPAPEPAPAQPAPGSANPDEPHWLPSSTTAVLQGLDKITGHVRTIEARIDQSVRFGTLDILVRTCRKRPPEEPPESAAYLQITESKPGEPSKSLFSGWMFASSPAVSALEDPVYDVWVIDCKGA
jgi:hypothetical protein